MRNLKVRHEPLPGIGDRFEFEAASGDTLTVVAHRSGRRDVAVGDGSDQPDVNIRLTRTEAIAVAALLSGAHIELQTTTSRG